MSTEATAPPTPSPADELRAVGIAMNGVTGRMGTASTWSARCWRSASRAACSAPGGPTIWPEPVLVGRKRAQAARGWPTEHGLERWTTDLDAALADHACEIYFDAAGHRRARGRHGAGDRGRQARLQREALGAGPRRRAAAGPLAARPASSTAWCRTSSSCPACASSGELRRRRLLRPHPVRARRVRLLGLRGTGAARRSGPRGTTAPRTAAGSSPTCFRTGTTCSTTCSRPVRTVFTLGATHIGERADEDGRPVRSHRRRRRLRHLRARGRHRRPAQLVLVRAGQPRRAGRVPGRRHPGQRRGRPARLPDTATRRHAASRSGTRTSPNPIDFRERLARAARPRDYDNGFKVQWELFLRHVVADEPVPLGSARGRHAEYSSPNWPSAPGRSGGCSRCRSSTREHRHRRAAAAARRRLARAPGPARAAPPTIRRASRCARACSSPPPTWWPTRWRPATRWAGRARLGGDARLPPPPLELGPRRGGGDGHRPARNGARLEQARELIAPLGGRGAKRRRAHRGRGRHRPAGAGRPPLARAHPGRLPGAVRVRRGAGRAR